MSLSEEFIEAKRIAIRTLCDVVIRSHDGCPDPELIAHFYHLIHQISVAKQEVIQFDCIIIHFDINLILFCKTSHLP